MKLDSLVNQLVRFKLHESAEAFEGTTSLSTTLGIGFAVGRFANTFASQVNREKSPMAHVS